MSSHNLRGHARIDQRSLEMHRAIATKLRADPSLLEIANDNMRRWRKSPGHSLPYFEAWQALLDGPFTDLLERMTEETERMTAMRQCSPFAGVLSPKERWAIYDEFALAPNEDAL